MIVPHLYTIVIDFGEIVPNQNDNAVEENDIFWVEPGIPKRFIN